MPFILWLFITFSPFLIVGLPFLAFFFTIGSNIVFIFSTKTLLFALNVGCDLCQGFFLKERFYQDQIGIAKDIYFKNCERNK